MDGTHISACPPTGEQMAYTNRHEFQSQNVLTMCDHDMRFIYVYARWEGGAHDARVLESALAYPSDFSLSSPGHYYLVDVAYRNVPDFIFPNKNVGPESPAKTLFNTPHSQFRNVIERPFGVLKKRFKILKDPVDLHEHSNNYSHCLLCVAQLFKDAPTRRCPFSKVRIRGCVFKSRARSRWASTTVIRIERISYRACRMDG
ncbi:putative nuclease HARBI1 [Coffea eugenioides]|uniref:putative nuclease HARBI1 n=1 Tax=Coffea eugenioides TaxID=49369 RepID=UPI000F60D546|nr:putative nuclease HARBI1 [Coffea eugenioides]